jgi:hypothetical protein
VQRRATSTGMITVAGQKVSLGRAHQHQTVTVTASETTLVIQFPDGDTKVIRRTTTQPVRRREVELALDSPQLVVPVGREQFRWVAGGDPPIGTTVPRARRVLTCSTEWIRNSDPEPATEPGNRQAPVATKTSSSITAPLTCA